MLAAGLIVFFCAGLRAQTFTVERDVPATMRDGTILRADIWRPKEAGPHPVLLKRTPYGKHAGKFEALINAGYIVVCQDVRGRYKSDGDFESFMRFDTHDAADGYDTVEWAAKLPGSTGKVGTFGASYDAFLQWRLAPLRPPSLVVMAASSIPARYTDLEGPGAFRPGRRLHWWDRNIGPDMRRRQNLPELSERNWNRGTTGYILDFVPWLELPSAVFATQTEAVHHWLLHPHLDPWALDQGCRDIAVPNLDIVGWYDHCNGSIDLHRTMRQQGKTKLAREHQRLIIGPWHHAGPGNRKVGAIDFGPTAALDIPQAQIRWFDYWLKNKPTGVDQDPPVKIFVMGVNRWRDEAEWPLARAGPMELFLTSKDGANTPAGDGRLLPHSPTTAAADHYRYDARDPVPTLWGTNFFNIPSDQRPLAERRDILVYQTDPLDAPLEVTGYPEVVLHAASSAPDTDFFVRLIDVAPDGTTRDVAMGLVRARFRDSLERPKLLRPGETTRFNIRMRPTANEFQAGHRIRLDITSSDFPNYDRNHNTAADQNADATLAIAEQTIHHGGDKASKLILPVIPRATVAGKLLRQ